MFVRVGITAGAALIWTAALEAGDEPAAAASADREAAELFEARVRPILAERCFGCHGAEKQKAGLRLDSREALLRGRDSGPVVILGEPEKSPMLLALRHAGEVKMPPKGKLPDDAIEAIAAWIRLGAPWPEGGPAGPGGPAGAGIAAGAPAAEARAGAATHWAFQPISDPPPPAVENAAWAATPLDRFVLAKLEERGMSPRPRADRRTLLRRMSIDLTGLPPAFEEVEAFAADPAPDAIEKAVEGLLSSPRYGERWGRHWLDVARYADTKGYVFEEERRFPYSYTYRDWVIRAFNEDLSYDRFIVEQIAADLLLKDEPASTSVERQSLAAMGFLTLGRRFLNNKHDIIDDRIDVVCRGVLGLTAGCARCHDHKFDPIPQADYYSLYGVFASAEEPKEPPLIGAAESTEAQRAFEKELRARESEVEKFVAGKREELTAEIRRRASEYLLAAAAPAPRREAAGNGEPKLPNVAAGELSPLVTARWRDWLARTPRAHHPVLAPWHAFSELKPEDFKARAPALAAGFAANADPQKPVNPLVAEAFAGEPPATLAQVAERYGRVFAAAEAPSGTTGAARDQVREVLHGEVSPASIPPGEVERYFDRAVRGKLRDLRKTVDQLKVTSPGAPPRAMSLEESSPPYDPVIFVRGNPSNPGRPVPRQFLGVLSRERRPFEHGSGRLELARAIASRENPLTARVMVNRVWMHHFGAGLVRTPGDFGTRSEPPTHPELLDWLASRFIEGGWSVKHLHRVILLSSTYEQASNDVSEYQKSDPENRLLWKFSRRRLDFEAMRDSLLLASGRLDLKPGGPAVDITKAPFSGRRSVYGFIDRQNLPGLFRTFDFASPDVSTPARHSTTVPQQALFLMNGPFAVENAILLAARPEVASEATTREKVQALYRTALARAPDEEEERLGVQYLERKSVGAAAPLTRLQSYAQVLLLSNEFAFVD